MHLSREFPPGDYDRNGVVDELDHTAWAAQYGQPVAREGDGADGNHDGVVDAADFTVYRDHFGAVSLPTHANPGPATIPEPTTTALALAAAVGFSGRPRHR